MLGIPIFAKVESLQNFCSTPDCPEGSMRSAGLFMDAKGNLYTTTLQRVDTADSTRQPCDSSDVYG